MTDNPITAEESLRLQTKFAKHTLVETMALAERAEKAEAALTQAQAEVIETQDRLGAARHRAEAEAAALRKTLALFNPIAKRIADGDLRFAIPEDDEIDQFNDQLGRFLDTGSELSKDPSPAVARIMGYEKALHDISNGEGAYGAQAYEYKKIAREALGLKFPAGRAALESGDG